MKTKIIKTVEVKELGAINMESIEASEGQLTVHIHLDKASGELENLLCKMQQDFMKKHPEVEEMRETKEAAVPSACDKDIYSYVMEYKVVTLGKLFDVDMRTVRRHLIKACEKLGYRGIRTYHFRKLYYGIKCVQ